MTTEEKINYARSGVALVGEIIRITGDNPEVKEAGHVLGKTALTVTKAVHNVLLPLAAFNFTVEKAKKYFEERFPDEIMHRAAQIPSEAIVEPKASVAGPTLQGLAFCHEEAELKEMYLHLLVSAMDGRAAGLAHPAFVEIIRQLDAKEARLLQTILAVGSAFPIAEIYFTPDVRRFEITTNTLYRHLLDIRNEETGQPAENPFLPAMVDNWSRLGLVEVDYERVLINQDYGWVESRPEFVFQCNKVTEKGRVTFRKGMMRRTAWGEQFSHAVGLASVAQHISTLDTGTTGMFSPTV